MEENSGVRKAASIIRAVTIANLMIPYTVETEVLFEAGLLSSNSLTEEIAHGHSHCDEDGKGTHLAKLTSATPTLISSSSINAPSRTMK